VFPEFLETCRDHVEEHEATVDTIIVAEFEQFEHECLTNDGLALVEYALDLKRRGCFVNLRGDAEDGHHRLLQQQQGFLMERLGLSQDQCTWDEVDDIASDVTMICCGRNGEDCPDGALVPEVLKTPCHR
jgi:hypothetical protein